MGLGLGILRRPSYMNCKAKSKSKLEKVELFVSTPDRLLIFNFLKIGVREE